MATKTTKRASAKKQSAKEIAIPQATVTPRLIVAQQKYGRWYVYFQGVRPEDNVGCGCKTAKSAIRYMHLLRFRYGAVISQNIYARLQYAAQQEG